MGGWGILKKDEMMTNTMQIQANKNTLQSTTREKIGKDTNSDEVTSQLIRREEEGKIKEKGGKFRRTSAAQCRRYCASICVYHSRS